MHLSNRKGDLLGEVEGGGGVEHQAGLAALGLDELLGDGKGEGGRLLGEMHCWLWAMHGATTTTTIEPKPPFPHSSIPTRKRKGKKRTWRGAVDMYIHKYS